MELWINFFGWFLSFVTAAGNGFVVLLIAKTPRLRSAANWLVLSLAIADFGVGVAVYPAGYICTNPGVCNMRVFMAFYWFFLHSSLTNLCCLTWDRYFAIVHPFKYVTSMSAKRPGLVILLAWFIPLAISLSLVLGMYATTSHTAWKVLRVTGVSAFDITSCILLFYAVVRILIVQAQHKHAVKSMEQQIQLNQTLNQSALPRRHNGRNTAGFIIAIVMFFLGCHVVVNYLILCLTFSCENMSDKAGLVLTFLLILNSAVNPFVYACMKRDIKRELKRLLCGKEQRNNHRERSGSTYDVWRLSLRRTLNIIYSLSLFQR